MNEMKLSEQLREARKYLTKRSNWMRGEYGNYGAPVRTGPYCVVGALTPLGGGTPSDVEQGPLVVLLQFTAGRREPPADINDSLEHKDVLDWLDATIEVAEVLES